MSFSPVSAAHLADLLGRSGQGCALWNAEGLLLMATPAWCQWLDVPEDASPIGQPLQGLLPARSGKSTASALPPPPGLAPGI
jgi:PAS domain-containing protein